MKRKTWIATGAVLLLLLLKGMLFVVDETQIVVVTRFGNPVRVITAPGLAAKLPPPFESGIAFDKRLQIFNPKPMEFLTGDKQNIIADAFICWRINQNETQRYLKSLREKANTELFLTDILISELGAALGKYELENLISIEAGNVKTQQIMETITRNCQEKCSINGLEVLTVRIKKINLPEQNKLSVYGRMSEERKRIAKKYRAEGTEKSMTIMAQADKEKAEIISEAEKQANIIRGEAEAGAMRIYAEAYGKNEEFYKFTRTLEAYENFVNEKTTIVLSPGSELMRLLAEGK